MIVPPLPPPTPQRGEGGKGGKNGGGLLFIKKKNNFTGPVQVWLEKFFYFCFPFFFLLSTFSLLFSFFQKKKGKKKRREYRKKKVIKSRRLLRWEGGAQLRRLDLWGEAKNGPALSFVLGSQRSLGKMLKKRERNKGEQP